MARGHKKKTQNSNQDQGKGPEKITLVDFGAIILFQGIHNANYNFFFI
jgi:hypothetical protein